MIWTHRLERLKDYLNSILYNIQFTMETGINVHLSLDINIYRSPDGFLGHAVYGKLANTILY
jgi:hypothetical protein